MLLVNSNPNRLIEHWTGGHCHLGDNICKMQWADYYQDAHPEKQIVVFGHRRCDCGGCNVIAGEQMKLVLSIMDTKVLWTNDNPPRGLDLPLPFTDNNIMYRKAYGLPNYKKNHVTTQFYIRGGFAQERNISGKDIGRIMHCLKGEKVYNLSDHHVDGAQHFHGSLREKLDLIATAKMHLSLDSGTAHLAAMTKTTTLAICSPQYWNRYRMQPNLICIKNTTEALPIIADLCLRSQNINAIKLL